MSYEEEIAFGVQQMLDADLQFPQEDHVREVTKKVQTNADRIRSMTDAEFAMHIVNTTRACALCPAFKSCEIKYPNFSACMNVVADWLKQPYGGDT